MQKNDCMYEGVTNRVNDYGYGVKENIDEWMVGNKDVIERYAMKLHTLVSIMGE